MSCCGWGGGVLWVVVVIAYRMPIFAVASSTLDLPSFWQKAVLWSPVMRSVNNMGNIYIWVTFTATSHGLLDRGGQYTTVLCHTECWRGMWIVTWALCHPVLWRPRGKWTVGCSNRPPGIVLSCEMHTYSCETVTSPKNHIFKITPIKWKGKVHPVTCPEGTEEGTWRITMLFL